MVAAARDPRMPRPHRCKGIKGGSGTRVIEVDQRPRQDATLLPRTHRIRRHIRSCCGYAEVLRGYTASAFVQCLRGRCAAAMARDEAVEMSSAE